MKLLSPNEVRNTKAAELTKDVIRITEYNKAADLARKNMANAEADFLKMLSGQRERWSAEENEYNKVSSEMQSEIKELKRKRDALNIPIEIEREKAHTLFKEAQEVLDKTKQKEQYVESLTELLEEKLDVVAQRETDVRNEEKRIGLLKSGIEDQKDDIKRQAAWLSENIRNFASEKDNETKRLKEVKDLLFLKERDLIAEEYKLKRKEKALERRDIKLEDDKGILKRAYIRLENKRK